MSNGWRALRRRILTPHVSATSLDVRGFHKKDAATREMLETVGRTFLAGYGHAVEARSVADAETRLEEIPARFRGFAYEGAAMGLAVLDGLPFGGTRHVSALLASPGGDRHRYTVHVGIGWAMARLPRSRWPRPDALDPLLRWLVLDGYGFHQAYFRTRRYVHERFQDPAFPWPGGAGTGYANRAIDQGIGRASWFVGGAAADVVADLIDRFPEHRRADLYAGAALAATYAGGGSEDELRHVADRAGPYRGQLAQGSAFAAEARAHGRILLPHTELATEVFCGMPPERAARVTQELRSGLAPAAPAAYETWRQRIADEFVSLGRC